MELWLVILLVLLALAVAAASVVGMWVCKAIRSKRSPDYDVEAFFKVPASKKMGDEAFKFERFPSLLEDAQGSLLLSVIVPAYKEKDRLVTGLKPMIDVLTAEAAKAPATFTWEVIIVDDGSKEKVATDQTSEIAMDHFVRPLGTNKVRLLTLHKNCGKGGAVKKGMLRARGRYLLFADADGATDAKETTNVLNRLRAIEANGLGMAIGSRAHLDNAEEAAPAAAGAEAAPKKGRTCFRRFLMWGFHTLINIMLGSSSVKDTQCGFKILTREAARRVFPALHVERWAFDVELLYLASHFSIPVTEVDVQWCEIDGSKIDVASDTLQMARDIISIRFAYLLGLWTADPAPIEVIATGGQAPVAAAQAAVQTAPAAADSEDGEEGAAADDAPQSAPSSSGKSGKARQRRKVDA